ELRPRERALALALGGEPRAAAPIFAELGTPLDRKYLGDIDAIHGELAGAVERWSAAVREEPSDLRLLTRLLELQARVPSPVVTALFRETKMAQRASATLEEALQTSPLRPSLWWSLATLLALRTETSEDALRAADRATTL